MKIHYSDATKILWLLSYMSNLKSSFGRWWIYSRILSQEKKLAKDSLCYYYYLNKEQLGTCLAHPRLLIHIGKGTKSGIKECQSQFQNERWNCHSGSHNSKLYKKRTPESAYIHAMSTAGVVYNVANECDRGKIKDCGCMQDIHNSDQPLIRKNSSLMRTYGTTISNWNNNDIGNNKNKDQNYKNKNEKMNKHTKINSNNKYFSQPFMDNKKELQERKKQHFWSYCTNHLQYGTKISRTFLDPTREETFNNQTHRSVKKLIVLQNNKAARKIIGEVSKQHKKCQCNGPSGKCFIKICYRWLPDIRVVAEKLYEKYQTAVQVKLKEGRKLVSAEKNRKLTKTDLVYTERLNYCNKNESLGIPGTKGRLCRKKTTVSSAQTSKCNGHLCEKATSEHSNTCENFCCDRGYNPTVVTRKKRCRCKFLWCCDVICKQCKEDVTEYRCK